MNDVNIFLQQSFFGNTLWQYVNLFLILSAGLLFTRFISRLSGRLLFRLFRSFAKDVQVEKFLELLQRPVSYTIMMVVLYFAFSQLNFPHHWDLAPPNVFGIRFLIQKGYFVFLYGSIIWIFLRIADFLSMVMQVRAEKIDNKYSGQIIPFLIDSVKIIVIIFGGLIILGSVFDLNVGALVTGLGIGGLAIALAAKETLENLLGSFTIFLDRPFVVGDMVRVGNITGVVEKVGFRSTRLRTLEKSFVTLPNKKMIDSELDNLTMRTFRRGDLTIGLTYSTSTDKLKAIVADIQEYIDNHPSTNQEGIVRLHDFGQSSLDIMVLFFVDTMDWTNYLDIKQEILYQIIDIVKSRGSDFAFPSTSIYIEKKSEHSQ
jgi:MscS family membrane protein